MKKHIYVDLHVVQTVPPSCVNRDDMGSPKTAVYGGTTRARVSSQAWKHAMRGMFTEIFGEELVGDRTKRVAQMIAGELMSLDPAFDEAKAMKQATEAVKKAGLGVSKKDEEQVDALMFMSMAQAKALAQLIIDGSDDKAEYKRAISENPSVDMALFGRMVAADPSLNYDAASQVAHSISTHTVHNEYDYFTAVDDLSPEDNAGAGHLGTIEFNSSTLYRYATVNVSELYENLGGIAPEVVSGFAKAFVCSMPTGKQNTFANRTLPDCVYITLREDQPVNLCGAFEKPISSKEGGYAEKSVVALSDYAGRVYGNFAAAPAQSWCVGGSYENLGTPASLAQALEAVKAAAEEKLSESEVR